MPRNTSTVYRPIFLRALKTAWTHKELWPFAVLAGLAGSGVIVNDLLSQASHFFAPSSGVINVLGGSFLNWVARYGALLIQSGPNHLISATLGALLVLASGVFLVVLCQQLIIVALHRTVKRKKHLSFRDLLRSLHHHHYWRIFVIDILFHLAIVLLLAGGGTLIRVTTLPAPWSLLATIFLAATTLFLAFTVNIVAMFSLIAIGEEHVNILQGILEGVDRFLRHPFVAAEVALLTFAANFVLTLLYLIGLTFVGLPIGLLFEEALTRTSLGGMIIVATVGLSTVVMYTVLFAGFVTTFTYDIWVLLVAQLNTKPFSSRFRHHLTRR